MAKPKEGVSSFQRANLKRPCIPGTRLSLRNAQLLVSSGIPSFDNFIGGGLPVGTIYCIEDVSGVFSTLMLKHFVAEGVLNGHFITLASQNAQPQELVKELPTPVVDSIASHTNSDQMKIAWRYEGLNPNEGSNSKASFGHIFDTSKVMDIETLDLGRISYWDPSEDVLNASDSSLGPYLNLLKFISRQIEACVCKVESKSDKKNIIRIALHCVASPLWQETSSMSSKQMLPQFLKFMYCLKSIVRSSYAVCMVTVPVHLFRDPCTVHRLRHVVDISAHVESFMDAEDETNEAYKEYSGLFHFKKLFSINTIVPHPSEGLDLAFKLRRKRFIIEKLCLPPDLSSSESSSSLGCASSVLKNPSSKRGCGSLDF
ncbi:elongator complex protein 4 isoform X2 [Ischnura elegans]|uniref:elongator complex protein 4 isoform X2 n=1 Tax=Ischnura elegans TaxID=197161 RepID=UPI001ED87FEB|nr:elongator complex protein 4 isoform X2 [Ischnura elegans]